MINGIKPIETLYKGYRFRSRLEARWAVFFDALGVEWEYEPEGFDLGDGLRYLPDFYLPKMNTRVEVKPSDTKMFDFNPDGETLDSIGGEDSEKVMHFVSNMDFAQYFMVVRGDPYHVFFENEKDNCTLPDFFFKGFAKCLVSKHKVFDPELPQGTMRIEVCETDPDLFEPILFHNCDCENCGYSDYTPLCCANVIYMNAKFVLISDDNFFLPMHRGAFIYTTEDWKNSPRFPLSDEERVESVAHLKDSAEKARQVRFEHGETPR